MIPLKLELENFMPYREPMTLDFAGLHVAVLAGENGAGKSALLDALTWALWGKARARTDNELIHLGQSEMEVRLTFQLGEAVYRVVRKRKMGKSGGGQTVLDLQLQHGDEWHTLAEPSVTKTQTKLERILRLNYETFINSAFLMQGRADEFTTNSASDRKRVLAEILGLQVWDLYADRAKARVAQVAELVLRCDAQIAEYDAELARRPDYERELSAAQAHTLTLSTDLRALELRFSEVERVRQALHHARVQLGEAERRVARVTREAEAARQERERSATRVQGFEHTLAARAEIEAGHADLLAARAAEQTLNDKLRQQSTYYQRRSALETQVSAARSEVSAERRACAQRVQELEGRARAEAVQMDLEIARGELAAFAARAAERTQAELARQGAADEHAHAEGRLKEIKQDADSIKERRELIEAAPASAVLCPVCGQPLGPDERATLLANYATELEARRAEYRHLLAQGKSLQERKAALDERLRKLDDQQRGLNDAQRREAQLLQRLQSAEEAARDLIAEQARLAALDARLAAKDFAQAEQAALAALDRELAALGYDSAAHDAVRAHLSELAPYEAQRTALAVALAGLAEAHTQAEAAQARDAQAQATLAAENTALSAAQAEVTEHSEGLRGTESLEAEVTRLRGAEGLARQKLGAAQQKLDACANLELQRVKRLEERDEAAREQGRYAALQVAFGKKGVPAMLIEAAVPEIEEAANLILGRMTANRLHVRLETQRNRADGSGTIETLEIKIADELGTRDYQLYSGGEAYRINFAVRMGLSRLLARRAGAQLQLLILDEGFGALDASGREQLIEAIHAVQDDFRCILVITHIEELRDIFPTRIEVTKGPQGSQAQIVA